MKHEIIKDLNSTVILVDGIGEYAPLTELEAAQDKIAKLQNDVLAQCITKLSLERNAQEAKRWAIQRAAEALLSAGTDAERKEAQRKLNAVVKDEYDYDEVETPRPNYFDYRELQRQHDELQTMFFNERKKSSELQAQVSKQAKVIQHIAAAVGEEADPMACWEAVDALIHKAESLEQEAKIHSSELDTQKSIVRDLCNLFGLRVHDYHCVSKVKDVLAVRDSEAINQHTRILVDAIMANSVPVQHYDANIRMRDALVNVINNANQLRQSAKAGE